MARVAGCKVVAHHAKIQDFDADFYREVGCTCLCGLHQRYTLQQASKGLLSRLSCVIRAALSSFGTGVNRAVVRLVTVGLMRSEIRRASLLVCAHTHM